MKAPPFAYVRAASLADVFRLWGAAGPEAKLLAGGQTLLASLAFRLSDPGTLIDISRVQELKGIAQAGDAVRVGALTTHAELGASEPIRRHVPLLAQAVPLIAHPAIRNRPAAWRSRPPLSRAPPRASGGYGRRSSSRASMPPRSPPTS